MKITKKMRSAVMAEFGERGGRIGGLATGRCKRRGDKAYYTRLSRMAARARAAN